MGPRMLCHSRLTLFRTFHHARAVRQAAGRSAAIAKTLAWDPEAEASQ